MNFFKFLSIKLAACSKPPSRDDYRKASYPWAQQRDHRVRIELMPCHQSCRKNDAFTLSATLPTIVYYRNILLRCRQSLRLYHLGHAADNNLSVYNQITIA